MENLTDVDISRAFLQLPQVQRLDVFHWRITHTLCSTRAELGVFVGNSFGKGGEGGATNSWMSARKRVGRCACFTLLHYQAFSFLYKGLQLACTLNFFFWWTKLRIQSVPCSHAGFIRKADTNLEHCQNLDLWFGRPRLHPFVADYLFGPSQRKEGPVNTVYLRGKRSNRSILQNIGLLKCMNTELAFQPVRICSIQRFSVKRHNSN